MYSASIRKILASQKIEAGDTISLIKKGVSYRGVLLPRPNFGNNAVLVLKLDSGYNIGILADKSTKIKLLKKKGRVFSKNISSVDIKSPYISLISTGGTIASKVDYETGGAAGLLSPEELVEQFPELEEISKIKPISPFTKTSEDMGWKDWAKIARECVKELNNGSEGVVVTHGTDFLHFTSSALSFMIQGLNKPIVITGSQRSSDRGSSDARMNLICSAIATTSNIAEVGVCMHATLNDDYCMFIRGTKVRKMHTSRRDAFRPINDFPLANIYPDGTIETIGEYKTRSEGKVVLRNKYENKVGLIKAYPGSDPSLIDYWIEKGYRGIVIETGALGHIPVNGTGSWRRSVQKAVKEGMIICGASQCLYGRMHSSVYDNLRKIYGKWGVIPLEDMLPETAYVKLGWALGNYKEEKVKDVMRTNIAGEITANSYAQTFLY